MARLIIEDSELVARLSALEKLAAFRGTYASRCVQSDLSKWSLTHGAPCSGSGRPGPVFLV